MQTYHTGDGDHQRVEVTYAPFADTTFEETDDSRLYGSRMGAVEGTVLALGEDPGDAFFDAYQQAREETDATLPEFEANPGYQSGDRTTRSTLLAFGSDPEDPVDLDAFTDAVEDALVDTLAGTVADWYAARPATEYPEADLAVDVERREDRVAGTYFAVTTDPEMDGAVMAAAEDRLTDEASFSGR